MPSPDGAMRFGSITTRQQRTGRLETSAFFPAASTLTFDADTDGLIPRIIMTKFALGNCCICTLEFWQCHPLMAHASVVEHNPDGGIWYFTAVLISRCSYGFITNNGDGFAILRLGGTHDACDHMTHRADSVLTR